MPTIREDIHTAAEWISKALSSSRYEADFSPNSLVEIDRFFSEHALDGKPVPGGLLSESFGSRIFSIGAYCGEVLRRNLGGDWRGDDSDPEVEINVELHLPDSTICWPMQRVMKRYKLGSSDSIAAWGAQAGLNITRDIWPALRPPENSTKPWWKLW
ncbi:MAG: hypothetical protein U0263_32060 [Polyangiaceae bacterium]